MFFSWKKKTKPIVEKKDVTQETVVAKELPKQEQKSVAEMTNRELMESMAAEIIDLRKELLINRVVFASCLILAILYLGVKFAQVMNVIGVLIDIFFEA